MQCIKTGCVVFSIEYHEYAYGDAFQTDCGALVVRCAGRSRKAEYGPRRHFTVQRIANWFDADETSMGRNSTMIAEPGWFENHGYDGEVI